MVPFEVGVVYRPRAGEIAVTFFVRSLDRDTILKTMPMEKLVPSAEECLANAQAATGANGNDKWIKKYEQVKKTTGAEINSQYI